MNLFSSELVWGIAMEKPSLFCLEVCYSFHGLPKPWVILCFFIPWLPVVGKSCSVLSPLPTEAARTLSGKWFWESVQHPVLTQVIGKHCWCKEKLCSYVKILFLFGFVLWGFCSGPLGSQRMTVQIRIWFGQLCKRFTPHSHVDLPDVFRNVWVALMGFLWFFGSYLTYIKLSTAIKRNESMAKSLQKALLQQQRSDEDGKRSPRPQDLIRLYDIILQVALRKHIQLSSKPEHCATKGSCRNPALQVSCHEVWSVAEYLQVLQRCSTSAWKTKNFFKLWAGPAAWVGVLCCALQYSFKIIFLTLVQHP